VNLINAAWSNDIADTLITLLGDVSQALADPLHAAQGAEQHSSQAVDGRSPDTQTSTETTAIALPRPRDEAHRNEIQAVALDTWEDLLRSVTAAEAAHNHGASIARDAIAVAGLTTQRRHLAVRAGRVLLAADADQFWPEIKTAAEQDLLFGRELALASSGEPTNKLITHGLNETRLADVYRWLSELFPSEQEVDLDTWRFAGPEQQARDWRDHLLRILAERGTPTAITALSQLAQESPNHIGIAAALVVARARIQANSWSPPTPTELTALLANANRRLVRGPAELAHLLTATLTQIEAQLPPHGELLWDRHRRSQASAGPQTASETAGDLWQPKPEAALSAYLAHELTLRLADRAIVVNREVLVQPTNAYGAGDRTDIKIDAYTVHSRHAAWPATAAPASVTVVIEVKGAWNRDLMTAQRNQLAARYLRQAQTNTGIYLIGWYPIDLWTATGTRRDAAARLNRTQVENDLHEQAARITRDLAVHVLPFLLTIPRPHTIQSAVEPS